MDWPSQVFFLIVVFIMKDNAIPEASMDHICALFIAQHEFPVQISIQYYHGQSS